MIHDYEQLQMFNEQARDRLAKTLHTSRPASIERKTRVQKILSFMKNFWQDNSTASHPSAGFSKRPI